MRNSPSTWLQCGAGLLIGLLACVRVWCNSPPTLHEVAAQESAQQRREMLSGSPLAERLDEAVDRVRKSQSRLLEGAEGGHTKVIAAADDYQASLKQLRATIDDVIQRVGLDQGLEMVDHAAGGLHVDWFELLPLGVRADLNEAYDQ